jgi:hypothetical protein
MFALFATEFLEVQKALENWRLIIVTPIAKGGWPYGATSSFFAYGAISRKATFFKAINRKKTLHLKIKHTGKKWLYPKFYEAQMASEKTLYYPLIASSPPAGDTLSLVE